MTAVRELREETGVEVTVEQLGQPFHRGRHEYPYRGVADPSAPPTR